MLATALRLQVLKPHATLSCIGEALGGWSLSPHNLTSLLLVLKRRRRWRQALLLVEYAQASGVPLRTMHLNLAISACSRSAPRRALALFAQMGSGEGLAGGVAPDVVSFNAAMAAAAAAGDEERVHELLDTMKEAGLSPSGISYNTAISACARRGDWEGALSYFREMEQRQVARNTVTYTAAIDACARGGELQKAITLFTYMEARRRRQQTPPPADGRAAARPPLPITRLVCGQVAGIKRNPVTYSVAISGCLRNGEPQRGLSLFEQMLERKVPSD